MARKVVTWVSTARDSVSLIERSSNWTSGILLVFAQILADAVEDHDLVVERIADDGEERGDARDD